MRLFMGLRVRLRIQGGARDLNRRPETLPVGSAKFYHESVLPVLISRFRPRTQNPHRRAKINDDARLARREETKTIGCDEACGLDASRAAAPRSSSRAGAADLASLRIEAEIDFRQVDDDTIGASQYESGGSLDGRRKFEGEARIIPAFFNLRGGG